MRGEHDRSGAEAGEHGKPEHERGPDWHQTGAAGRGVSLRAHLLVSFPAAAGVFCKLESAISLAFLARFDCQDRADWLSEKRLAGWLKAVGYSGHTSPAELTSG